MPTGGNGQAQPSVELLSQSSAMSRLASGGRGVDTDSKSGLRYRLTTTAALVSAAVLTANLIVLMLVVRHQVRTNVDTALNAKADALIAGFTQQDVAVVLAGRAVSDTAAQLVTTDNVIVASSESLAGQPPVAPPPPEDQVQTFVDTDSLPLEGNGFRILSRRLQTPEQVYVLHLMQADDTTNSAVKSMGTILVIGVPLLTIALTSLIWMLLGKALDSVDAMRSRALEIARTGGGALPGDKRVPVPNHGDTMTRLATTFNEMLDLAEPNSVGYQDYDTPTNLHYSNEDDDYYDD